MGKTAEKNTVDPKLTKKSSYELLLEEIEVKRLSLEKSLSAKVHAFCFRITAEDSAVMYLTEPNFQVKKMAMDMSLRSLTDAAELVLNTCIIKEESDQRLFGETCEEDYPELRLGAIMECQGIVTYYSNALKKKF